MYDGRMQDEPRSSGTPSRRLTYEDFLLFPDDGRRHEIIDQIDILTEMNVQGAPALVVEILSGGTRKRDLHIKRRLFDCGGVREHWAVDPTLSLVTVFARHGDGRFPQVASLLRERADVLTTPLLPGLTIPLNELFV
jgi:Uma2 family endonuclease